MLIIREFRQDIAKVQLIVLGDNHLPKVFLNVKLYENPWPLIFGAGGHGVHEMGENFPNLVTSLSGVSGGGDALLTEDQGTS